jgi:quinohemoprotein ethanol dehydrogenase
MSLAKILSLALVSVVCLCAACAAGDVAAVKRSKDDDARELFARNCAACHGQAGEGKQVGTLQVPPLREGRAVEDTNERLLSQIHDGGKGMPPFKYTLTDDQIQDLLRFVREEIQRAKK